MNKYFVATAAFTGLLCGVWGGFAGDFGLSAWAGFASCTAYFACSQRKIPGAVMTLTTTLVGMFYAWLMIWTANLLGGSSSAYAFGVGLFVMCIVLSGKFKWTTFVPGMFVGCYSLFAMPGNDMLLLGTSLAAGTVLGYRCDVAGAKIFAQWNTEPAAEAG